MPRGQPDYGVYEPPAIAKQTIWVDDFEAPILKWVAAISGGGVLPILTTTIAFQGIQCVYFDAPIGALSASYIYRRFPLLKTGKVGFEVFVCGTTETQGYIYLRANISDGVNQTGAEWRIDTTNYSIAILSGGVAHPIATDIFAKTGSRYFLPVKIVADTISDYYTDLIVGPDSYDLSSYPLEAVGGPGNKLILVTIGVSGHLAAVDSKAYADNFILTQNEP